MTLATLPDHDPSCSGCPTCSVEMAYILAHPNEPRPRLVTASGRPIAQPVFRTTVQRWAAQVEVPPPPNFNAAVRALNGIPEPTPTPRAAAFAGDVPPAPSFQMFNAMIRATRGVPPPQVPTVRAATASGVPAAISNEQFAALVRAHRGDQ